MRKCMAISLVVVAASSPFVQADDDCVVNLVMDQRLKEANERSKGAIDSIKQRDIEEEGCLPTLASLTGGITATIPSFSLGDITKGLVTKIRDMACNAMDGAIAGVAEDMNASWEAPYGLGGVSVGTGQSGANSEFSSETQDMIESEIKGAINKELDKQFNAGKADVSEALGVDSSVFSGVNRKTGDRTERAKQQQRTMQRQQNQNSQGSSFNAADTL